MHIKVHKNAWSYVLILSCAWILGGIITYFEDATLLTPMLLFFLIPVEVFILYSAVIACREIEMDSRGYMVRFLFYSRYYRWDQLVTCRREEYRWVNYKTPYDDGLCLLCPPGWFQFVYFVPKDKKLREAKNLSWPLYCCVDRTEFLEKMKEWNVPIENL